MLPRTHFLIGILASLILLLLFPTIGILNVFIFLLASVLIDVDHYLYYVYRERDWNLVRAVKWFFATGEIMKKIDRGKRREIYTAFCFLHGTESLVLFVILGRMISEVFYFVVLGFGFHLGLDYIRQIINGGRFDRVSVIWDYFKYSKLRFIDDGIK